MTALNFDSEELAIPCPKCGDTINRTIRQLHAAPDITCSTCGSGIHVDTAEFDKSAAAAGKELDDLFKGK
jgi:predicted RNA-binding Zn-ribbon protein involved in translation (DUF1610 family)